MNPEEADALVRELVAGHPDAAAVLLATASHSPRPRDRQLSALAAAHLEGDHDRATVLAREHLLEHPDSRLAAWVATRAGPLTGSPTTGRTTTGRTTTTRTTTSLSTRPAGPTPATDPKDPS